MLVVAVGLPRAHVSALSVGSGAVVVVDAGDAFDTLEEATGPLVGVGTELRLNAIVGWAVGLQFRAGYAFAVYGPGGYSPIQVETLYLRIGTSL